MKNRNRTTRRKTNMRSSINWIFLIGLAIFAGGLFGIWKSHFATHLAANTLPQNITAVIQIESKNANKIQNLPWSESAVELLKKIKTPAIKNWIGAQSAFAITEKNDFILMAEYRSKSAAEKFLATTFLVGNEKFTEKKSGNISYKTAEFSSNVHYFFQDDWLILTDKKSLIPLFDTNEKLHQTDTWKNFIEQKNRSENNFVFINLNSIKNSTNQTVSSPENQALLDGIASIFPAAGISFSDQTTKIIITQNQENIEKITPQNTKTLVPEIFSFLPQNPLFLFTGTDLNTQIQSSTDILSQAHPQYGVLFKNILPSLLWKEFADNPQIFEEFVEKLHGQYALVALENPETKKPEMIFISRFGVDTQDKKIELINEIIKETQANLVPTVETVELPNGRTRDELVAKPNQVEIETQDGVMVAKINGESGLSYGFKNGYLIVANHAHLVQTILETTPASSIAQQKNFRNFVLFNAKNSDRYGIIEPQKIQSWLNIDAAANGQETLGGKLLNFLAPTSQPLFFQRMSTDEAVVWEFKQAE